MRVLVFPHNDLISRRIIVGLAKFCYENNHDLSIFYAQASLGTSPDKRLNEYLELERYFTPGKSQDFGCQFYQRVADKYFSRVFYFYEINSQECLSAIQKLQPNVAFSVRVRTKFGKELINEFDTMRAEFLNLHTGPLPEIRGLGAIFRSFEKGRRYHAYTLHEIEEEFDTGKIISQKNFGLDASETVLFNILNSWRCGLSLLTDHLGNLRDSFYSIRYPQDENAANYYSLPKSDVIDRLESQGIILALQSDLTKWDDGWALSNRL